MREIMITFEEKKGEFIPSADWFRWAIEQELVKEMKSDSKGIVDVWQLLERCNLKVVEVSR